jgi:hypothetical protein
VAETLFNLGSSGDDRKPLQALWMVSLTRRIARWVGSFNELCKFFQP